MIRKPLRVRRIPIRVRVSVQWEDVSNGCKTTLKTESACTCEVNSAACVDRESQKWLSRFVLCLFVCPYGRAKALESINTRKLASHIADHGSIYTSDVVFGVLEKFRSCLVEMLLNSKRVKIDGLGTFYCSIESSGCNTKEKYSVTEHIRGLHIRFLPEQATEMDLSSRQFLKRAEFINVDQLKPDPEAEPEPEP